MTNGLRILLIVVASFISYLVIKLAIDKSIKLIKKDKTLTVDQVAKRAHTLGGVLKGLAKFIIFFVALTMILKEIGINPTPILAGAGIAGLAIGFGAQSLVRDIISGFFILFENQYSVGDIVQIGQSTGLVENINLKTTQLRDAEGKLHIIPNGEIKTVINASKKWARALVDINVSYEEDINKVISIIDSELAKIYKDKNYHSHFLEEPRVLGIEDLGATSIVIRITAKTPHLKKKGAEREIRLRIKNRLDKESIKISS